MSAPHPGPQATSANPLEQLTRQLEEHIQAQLAEPPFQRDEAFIAWLLPWMETFCSYFDAEVRGMEALPASGPLLLVGNHSGGLTVPDTSATIAGWYRTQGLDRPLLGLAFDAMFAVPGMAGLMRKIGQVPANPENAAAALASGASLLVYPGGARDAFRPWHDRNRIDFCGRKGFIQLALRAGVPVVPVVGHGGAHTNVVLSRGEELARWLGMERWRLDIAPILLQVPWGLSLPLQPGMPLPAKILVEVGAPIDWRHLGADAADDPAVLERCYEEITGQMQTMLDGLARECPYPVATRLIDLIPGARSLLGGGRRTS